MCTVAALAGANPGPRLTSPELGPRDQIVQLLADASGNRYLIGVSVSSATLSPDLREQDVLVLKLDPAGTPIFRAVFGGSRQDAPAAAALDPDGNLLVAGVTLSEEFPKVRPLFPDVPAGNAFLMKLGGKTGQVFFSTLFVGTKATYPAGGPTGIQGLTVDPRTGDIFLTGSTSAPDFPVTPEAFQKSGGAPANLGLPTYAFVSKISASGDKLLYSTFLTGHGYRCTSPGSGCLGVTTRNQGGQIAVDREGRATVSGFTNAPDFPVSPNAPQRSCGALRNVGCVFVARLNVAGSALLWSTFLGGSAYGADAQFPLGGQTPHALALDDAGNALVAGSTSSPDFPVTPGAIQESMTDPPPPGALGSTRRSGFLTSIDATGTRFLFSTFLGGSGEDAIRSLAIGPDRRIWISGVTASRDFPVLPGPPPLGASWIFALDASARRIQDGLRLPKGVAGGQILLLPGDGILTRGATGSTILELPSAWSSEDRGIVGIGGSASTVLSGRVSPGEFLSLYGYRLGPTPEIGAALDAGGRVAAEGGGVKVLFDGRPAPLLYAGPNQINVIVPFAVALNRRTRLEVRTPGGASETLLLNVDAAHPQVLRQPDPAWALAWNQDGSWNSPTNPAKPGEVLSFYLNGLGTLDPELPDGALASEPLAKPLLPVEITLQPDAANVYSGFAVEYLGAAPGLVQGLIQVNIRVPRTYLPSLAIDCRIDGVRVAGPSIFILPAALP